MVDRRELDLTIQNLVARLLEKRTPGGWWEGRLASSALATATAVGALSLATNDNVTPGLDWLAANQNADGGWGDTVLNRSNISTTILCWCSFAIARADARYGPAVSKAEAWLIREAGGLDGPRLAAAILRRYGNDRTFSVPILTVMAIAGKCGQGAEAWKQIPQLPFELAAMPHQFFASLRLPVVSYALPALIAIGQVRHRMRPSGNLVARMIRNRVSAGTLELLRAIQPASGGYLEATPLTSFVLMSLVTAGYRDNPVVPDGVRFLRNSMRGDGSWPIDTDLATWVTTLSVNALSRSDCLGMEDRQRIREWLLSQQYREIHPYTHVAPGGWAWTPLSGGVPDADDTPGALLALRNLGPVDDRARQAGRNGVRWLLDLRNSDGGMPTFCRGWGKLPFDRSSADLTAHALTAWRAWLPDLDEPLASRTREAIAGALRFLERVQSPEGAWTPLWFGNEHTPEESNPVYGTARTLLALQAEDGAMAGRGVRWLAANQNDDGGWGGGRGTPSSVEETALAVQALAKFEGEQACWERGVAWLMERTKRGLETPAAPIGLYFARLWYFEELYPLIFAVGSLTKAQARLRKCN